MELKNHKTCIFGIQESGKTYWAKKMYKQFKKPIVFSLNTDDGWDKLKGLYVWKVNRQRDLLVQFEEFISNCRKWALQGKVDLIIIDEADLFFRGNYDISSTHQDLVLNHRHMGKGVALWYMTRRPQDIPTKIVESSKHLIVFKLEGANAIKKFEDIHPKIPELINNELDFDKKNFIYKEIGRDPVVKNPV